ncbi:lysylphosphatidylglycerol synthase transmembrane domain-containing protein [Streptomyces sp. NBC_01429]|uniref:lysylphosphatidylglycerol synthase transmembrane domain-containing protein n=1 Tax=Streptomyces sp. NBC_01429 TaxID=2903862 RepID=UPI002E2D44C7|nr:YbhN family protein [Streptomyces sp. NBC_01429]
MVGRPGGHEGDLTRAPVRAAVRPWWWVVAAVLVALAVAVAVTRRHELVSAVRLIGEVRPYRLLVAAVCEAASLLCLAALQRWLLRAGGARVRLRAMAALVLAGNAIAGALPGGAAFAAAWVFRRLRRRGVEQVLAGAVLAVAGTLSALSLFVLLVAGVLVAGSSGPASGLRGAVVALAVAALVVAGVAVGLSRFPRVRRRAWRGWRRLGLRSRRLWDVEQALSRLGRHVRATRPGPRPWLRPAALAVLNWGFDLACLVTCVWSLGIGVPWHGILAAYALTQFAGSLRLTPGGLGVVETSLTALLVVYGLSTEQAIAVTLLYRVVSYWALQPVGWACGLGLTLADRRGTPDSDHAA